MTKLKSRKKLTDEEKQARKDALSRESKAEKFKRLSVKRVNKALDAMKTIINLSSPAYESTPEQQEKIVNALRLRVLDIENSFKSESTVQTKFSL